MELRDAERVAREVTGLLAPACERIVVCGSVRRQRAQVKDLEIVVLPKRMRQRPVFGDATTALPPLDALLERLTKWGELKRNTDNPKWGEKYKTLLHPATRLGIDLFIAAPDNFGNLVTIRTGDQTFSHLLVTPRDDGGLMPRGMRQMGGYLWQGDTRVPCWLEGDFFAALGIDQPPPPELRDERMAIALRKNTAFANEGAKNAV